MSKESFVWTDELVAEFADGWKGSNRHGPISSSIRSFIQSKTPTPKKKWEVVEYRFVPIDLKCIVVYPGSELWKMAESGHKDFAIHSVRRLSDGEVFTVGGTLLFTYEKLTLRKIEIRPDTLGGLCLICFDDEIHGTKICEIISDAKKLPPQSKPEQPSERPPLGLTPMWLWREQRLDDLNEAIDRYNEFKKEIPSHWVAEKQSLESFLQDEQESKYKKSEQPKKDETKVNLTYETVEQWLSHQPAVAQHGTPSYTFLYRGIACHGQITVLPYNTELRIRPQNILDDIGNGTGGAVTITFFREPEQPKKDDTFGISQLNELKKP